MKLKMKLNLIKLTLNQLLQSGAHLGQPHRFLHRQIKPYLLGFKSKFSILNMKYTQLQLKLLLHIIINTVSLRQKVLVVNHYKEIGSFLPLLKLKRCFITEGL
jgi:ribosomal protein S2